MLCYIRTAGNWGAGKGILNLILTQFFTTCWNLQNLQNGFAIVPFVDFKCDNFESSSLTNSLDGAPAAFRSNPFQSKTSGPAPLQSKTAIKFRLKLKKKQAFVTYAPFLILNVLCDRKWMNCCFHILFLSKYYNI